MPSFMHSPAEIATVIATTGYMKGNIRLLRLLPLGILAGVFIAIGALSSTILKFAADDPTSMDTIIASSVFFTIGIVLVVLAGGELFTGNMLMVMALLKKDLEVYRLLRNWFWVYISNFIGSVFILLMCYYTGMFTEPLASFLVKIVDSKLSLTFTEAVFKGIGCNMLVCLSVWIATSSKSTIGKIFASSFPIMIFIVLGFEHCVANMFFLPAGYILGAKYTIIELALNNLLPVTIGNVIGGILITLLYYFAYSCKYVKFNKPRGFQ